MKNTFNAESAEIAEQEPLRSALRAPRGLRLFSGQHTDCNEPKNWDFPGALGAVGG
jgi:hypothetical protein